VVVELEKAAEAAKMLKPISRKGLSKKVQVLRLDSEWVISPLLIATGRSLDLIGRQDGEAEGASPMPAREYAGCAGLKHGDCIAMCAA